MVKKFIYQIVYPNGKLKVVKDEQVLYELYYKLARIPTLQELGKGLNKDYLIELKRQISMRTEYVPLFDIYSNNIYLIKKENIFKRIKDNNFRLPNKQTQAIIESEIQRLTNVIKKISKTTTVPKYYTKYLDKLKQQIMFLTSFDFPTLQDTFYRVYFDNNPYTEEITSCKKPSFFPFLRNSPYYTKKELINLGKNMGVKVDDSDINKTCEVVSKNDIDAVTLNRHNIYIKDNDYFKAFVHYYTFIGSFYLNNYMRNTSIHDAFLEKQIETIWYVIRKAPFFDKNYYVYRFVNNISFLNNLKVGDIYEDNGFISTTRNPFYDPKNNVFGYVLMKINIPANMEGVGLCLESFSFFRDEQEILLPPGKLLLKSIDSKYVYNHTNPVAAEKITKKYEFDYIEAFTTPPSTRIHTLPQKTPDIIEIDFKKLKVNGDTIDDKMEWFYDNVTSINKRAYFYSYVGQRKLLFQVYKREDLRVYDKYFFLQQFEHIYFIVQDEETQELLMLAEIRERISINYLFKFIGVSNKFEETELLTFLSYLGKAFDVHTIMIHDDWESYQLIAEQNMNDNYSDVMDFDNPDTNFKILLYSANTSFYPKDLVGYMLSLSNYNYKDTVKKYRPKFNLKGVDAFLKKDDIGNLQELNFNKLSDAKLNTPINKVFLKFQAVYGLNNVLDFYIYLHFHYFYLIIELNRLMFAYFEYNLKDINPWNTNFYILSPDLYLYENGLQNYMPDLGDTFFDIVDVPDNRKSEIAKKLRVGKKIKN
jgi:hypothetical protein